MLDIKNISIQIENRYLVQGLSFSIHENDKLAIIGEEGNGKSTFLKSIIGLCDYSHIEGSVICSGAIGYLPQFLSEEDLSKMVFDYLFEEEQKYYEKIKKLYQYLEQLKIDEQLLQQNMNQLSGGEKVKISILKLLLEEYDFWLLDEPTNDLDLNTLQWLEKLLTNTSIPMIFVSHDEMFLSKVANMILHIEQVKKKQECKATFMKIGYDDYVERRLRTLQHQSQMAVSEKRQYQKKQDKLMQIMNKVEYQQNTISRKDPHGAYVLKKKMHSLKSQEKRMQESELTERPDVEEQIYFQFSNVSIPNNKEILKLDIPCLSIQNKILANNIHLYIRGNEHIVIIGDNGVGKTTLLKEIYSLLETRKDIKVGYMPQNYDEILFNYSNSILFLCDGKNKLEVSKVRSYLGNMNFTKEEMNAPISSLSGGSKAKLFLSRLVLEECNVLLLDEPTRNVSPLSNPLIRQELKNFKGTIISVSHDRKYIREVIDKIYCLSKNGLEEISKESILE